MATIWLDKEKENQIWANKNARASNTQQTREKKRYKEQHTVFDREKKEKLEYTDPEFQGQVQVKCSQIKVNLVSQLAQRILSDSNPEPKLCLGLLNILEPKAVLSLLSKIYLGFGQDYR